MSQLFAPRIEYLQLQQGRLPEESVSTNMEGRRANGEVFPVRLNIRNLEIDGCVYRVLLADDRLASNDREATRLRSQIFESLERFASGLALELNNVLTGVLGNIHLAMEESGRRGRLQPALLEAAHNASLRARELTKELLEFANGDGPDPYPANLHHLVRENCLIALSGSRMKCEFDFSDETSAALLDPAQFGQVIHQLVSLATELTGHSGTLKFKAGNQLIESEEDAFGGQLMYGNYVAFTMEIPVTIPEDEIRHLFEPYSMHAQRSSGLSLAIARSIIKRHKGLLTAETSETGLLARIFLPASVDSPQETAMPLDSGVPGMSGARILVVDDQQLVRLVLQRSLEGIGHRVTACENGDDAIDVYLEALENNDRFDVVFLDINIPGGMGGGETCRCLREIDPQAACVVISGNTTDELMTNFEAFGFVEYLSKPFDVDTLEKLVEDLIKDRNILEWSQEEDDDGAAIALPFSDNIVEIDFTSPNRTRH